jgi:hypothetical protein
MATKPRQLLSRVRMCLQGLARWRPELEDELGPLPTGFFDTPIIVYLLKTRPEYFKRCVRVVSQRSVGSLPGVC